MTRLDDLRFERLKRRYAPKEDLGQTVDAFVSFCREQIKVRHPSLGLIPLELREPQIETITAYLENQKTITLKARQIGFTTASMIFALWEALYKPYYSFINLSKRETDAVAALGMAKLAYDSLDPRLKARLPKLTDNNQKVMTFDNGSYMESHPSSNSPARSRTVTRITLDEYAFMPDDEEAWAAIEPTADVGGSINIISTAHGYDNDFQRKWEEATSETGSSIHPIFYPWWALPERDEAWYEAKKKSMQVWQLHQEYPSTPEEAFRKSGNNVFDTDKLVSLRTRQVETVSLTAPEGQWRGVQWHNDMAGPLRVYEYPQAYAQYVVGADVAQGLEHGDFSSAHVIDIATGHVVAHWHGHMDPDLFGLETARLAAMYNMALLGTEVNNHGLTTVKAQQRCHYPRVFHRTLQSNFYGDQPTTEVGFLTTAVSKPRIIDELHGAIRDDAIRLEDRATIQEMIRYVRDEKGKMGGSPFDDRVMSLAIALHMVHFAHTEHHQSPVEENEWTVAWWSKQIDLERDRKVKEPPIGTYNVRRGPGRYESGGTSPLVR